MIPRNKAIDTNVSSVEKSVDVLDTSVSNLSTSVSNLSTSVSNLSAKIDTINTNITNLQNANKYSTTATAVGTWKDGKTIYRKVITSLSALSSNWSRNDISSLGASTIIHVEGQVTVLNTSSVSSVQPIPRNCPDNEAGYGIGIGDITASSINILFGTGYSKISSGWLIIEYTKA